MQKTFFILPGFKQSASSPSFSWLAKLAKDKGFKVVKVAIDWDRRTMVEYTEDFRKVYFEHKSRENYVLGFSYGAVVAFLTASELKPKKIFLCSLSPDFKEDVVAMKSWVRKYIGKNRLAHSKATSAVKIAKALKIPSIVFYGEKEGKQYPQLKVRCTETVRFAKNSKLVVVKAAPHKIDFPAYREEITKSLSSL